MGVGVLPSLSALKEDRGQTAEMAQVACGDLRCVPSGAPRPGFRLGLLAPSRGFYAAGGNRGLHSRAFEATP